MLFGIRCRSARGEMVALLGRNGMGKTTTIRSIMGLTPARPARSVLPARRGDLPSYQIAKLGMAWCPKDARSFPI